MLNNVETKTIKRIEALLKTSESKEEARKPSKNEDDERTYEIFLREFRKKVQSEIRPVIQQIGDILKNNGQDFESVENDAYTVNIFRQ